MTRHDAARAAVAERLNRPRMLEQLILHEGLHLRLYRDPRGILTGGAGYNVEDRGVVPIQRALKRSVSIGELQRKGLTREEWLVVLDADVTDFEALIRRGFPLYEQLVPEPRKRALVDFVFNLGNTRAATFRKARAALELAIRTADPRAQQAFFYETAWHVMDSLWSRQVDDGLGGKYGRADRVCEMLISGRDWTR